MNPSILTRRQQIEAITLTPEELAAAILEGKIKKYHGEKNAPYWDEQEKRKPKKDDSKKSGSL